MASATVSWPRAAGVGEQRVGAVEQPQLALLEGGDVVDEAGAGGLPVGRPAGKSPLSTHSLNGSVTTGAASSMPAASTAGRRGGRRGVIRSTMVRHEGDVRVDPGEQRRVDGVGESGRRGDQRAVVGQVVAGDDRERAAPARRRAASPATSRGGVHGERREASRAGSPRSASRSAATSGSSRSARRRGAGVAGLGDRERDDRDLRRGRCCQAPRSAPACAADDGWSRPRRGPLGARARSACRGRPARSASAASGARPVKAAMPHSAASGARSVYQAWWARKKLPSPRCTMRTGGRRVGAGSGARAARSGAGSALTA